MKLPYAYLLVLLLLLLSGCGIAAITPPTATVIPSQTPLPTATFAPTATSTSLPTSTLVPTPTQPLSAFPEIKTVVESLSIEKVELADHSLFDEQAPEGKQFLTLWLVRTDGVEIDVLYFLKVEPRSKEIYAISSDGTIYHVSGFGNADGGKLFVRFTVQKNSTGFQFSWPDNDLIDLGLPTE